MFGLSALGYGSATMGDAVMNQNSPDASARMARMPRSLDDLWRDAGAGDDSAFALLYDQLAPIVYGICLRVLRDPDLALEAAQEALLQVWQQAPLIDAAKGSVKGWACTIAHRRAVDSVRSNESRRRREAAVHVDPTSAFVTGAIPESSEVGVERGLGPALLRLSDVQRQAIELAYFGGQTYRQVAVTLGVPAGTIKSRIRDGLIQLRSVMEPGIGVETSCCSPA